MALESLVPQPGIQHASPALEAWSLHHWTAREIPSTIFEKHSFLTGLLYYFDTSVKSVDLMYV